MGFFGILWEKKPKEYRKNNPVFYRYRRPPVMMTHAGQCIDAPRTRVRHLSKRAPVGVPLCCKDTARSRGGNERRLHCVMLRQQSRADAFVQFKNITNPGADLHFSSRLQCFTHGFGRVTPWSKRDCS